MTQPLREHALRDDQSSSCSFHLAQRAQLLAGRWFDLDVAAMHHVIEFMRIVPKSDEPSEQAAIAFVLATVARRFARQSQHECARSSSLKRVGLSRLEELHALRGLRFVLARYRRTDCSLAQVAVHCNLTPTYLSQILVRAGSEYRASLRTLRLLAAIDALAGCPLSIKALASSVGYAHSTTFEHAFQQHVGMPPNRFRCLVAGGDGTLAWHSGIREN